MLGGKKQPWAVWLGSVHITVVSEGVRKLTSRRSWGECHWSFSREQFLWKYTVTRQSPPQSHPPDEPVHDANIRLFVWMHSNPSRKGRLSESQCYLSTESHAAVKIIRRSLCTDMKWYVRYDILVHRKKCGTGFIISFHQCMNRCACVMYLERGIKTRRALASGTRLAAWEAGS